MTQSVRYLRYSFMTVGSALFVGAAFYLLRIVLYSRLTSGEYAAVYAAMALSQIVFPLLAFGLGPGLIPEIARHKSRGDPAGMRRAYAVAMTWEMLLCLLFLAVVLPLSLLLGRTFIPWLSAGPLLIRWVAVYSAAAVVTRTVMAALMGAEAVGWRAGAEAVYAVGVLGAGWVFTAQSPRADWALAAYLVGIVLMFAAARLGLASAVPALRRPAWPSRFASTLGGILKEGKYLTGAVFGMVVFAQLDTIMLSALLGEGPAVAGYQVAVPTAVIVQTLLLAATQPLVPMAVAAASKGQTQQLQGASEGVYRWAWTLLFPAAALLATFGDVGMRELFGRELHGAPAPFAILALSLPAYLLCWYNLHLLAGLQASRPAAWAVALGLMANAALNALLIPLCGTLGAAVATAAGFGLAAAASAASLQSRAAFRVPWRAAVSGGAVGVCLAGGALALRQTTLYAAHPLLGAVLAAPVLYLLGLGVLQAAGAARIEEGIRLMSRAVRGN